MLDMQPAKKPLLFGNWKLNPPTLNEAKMLFRETRKIAKKYPNLQIAVAVPTPFLSGVSALSVNSNLAIMVQDVWHTSTGAETGVVSVPMVRSCGASHTLIGHSEVRARGETDEQIAKKIYAADKGKLTAVLCVGEQARDDEGQFYNIVTNQITKAFAKVSKATVARSIIAYEPVWSIGTGQTPSEVEIEEMKLFIEKVLTETYGRNVAKKVPILYGGSVSAQNASTIFRNSGVDGFLVGGASLRPNNFSTIAKSMTE